jgi:hypothetical protein
VFLTGTQPFPDGFGGTGTNMTPFGMIYLEYLPHVIF